MAIKKTAKKTSETLPAAPAKAAVPGAKKSVKAAKKAVARKTAPKVATQPSPDVIARAAYLNYRRRVEQELPGDARGDWLEAERYFSATQES